MTQPLLNFTSAAKADLQEIWRHTENKWGEEQAKLYLSALTEACHQLTEFPQLGKAAPDVGEDVRVYRCRDFYIFLS